MPCVAPVTTTVFPDIGPLIGVSLGARTRPSIAAAGAEGVTFRLGEPSDHDLESNAPVKVVVRQLRNVGGSRESDGAGPRCQRTAPQFDGRVGHGCRGTPIADPQEVSAIEDTVRAIRVSPAANYNGPDSFTFSVKDGTSESAPATVSISIAAVNDTPVATAQSVWTVKYTALNIALSGTDVDGDALTYTVVAQPTFGEITGAAPGLT